MAMPQLIDYPFSDTPEAGAAREVAPGVFWLRMPLDMTGLDHINLWLLADGPGWTVVDTGLQSSRIKQLWQQLFSGAMAGRPITRLICTHFHPDHMGLAGWLQAQSGAPLWASRREWLFGRMLYLDDQATAPDWFLEHYRRVGLSEAAREQLRSHGYNGYRRMVSAVPEQYRRIADGETLEIGGRRWQVIAGFGHSPEHACLYCAELDVLISGDQVLPRITPHIGVYPSEPEANPLQEYIDSFDRFAALPDEALVLPAHGLPFHGLQRRLVQLREHHADRLTVLEACCDEPTRVLSTLKVMFGRRLKPFEAFLGVNESLAHLNCLIGQGRVVREEDEDGVWLYRTGGARADAA